MQKSFSTCVSSQLQQISLPRRPSESSKSLGTTMGFVTNYYKVQLCLKQKNIYQFSLQFEPEIAVDSGYLIKKLVYSSEKQIEQKIGSFIVAGRMLWGLKQSLSQQHIKCKFVKRQGNKETIFQHVLRLKRVCVIQFEKADKNVIQQILNSKLRNLLLLNPKSNLIEMGKSGKFFNKSEINERQIDRQFKIWRGFLATIHWIDSDLYLCVDISTRVLSTQNVLEILNSVHPKYYGDFEQRSVLAQYGKYKTYTILKIVQNKNPQIEFDCKGKKISLLQYYKKQYGITIKNTKQCLILSQVEIRKQNKKELQDVYLIPQLLHFTGVGKKDKFNKDLAKQTKLTPNYRLDQNYSFIKNIPKNNLFNINPDQKVCSGYILPSPTVAYNGNKVIELQKKDGRMILKDKRVLQSAKIKDWIIIYTYLQPNDGTVCDSFLKSLNIAAQSFGIQLPKPIQFVVKDGSLRTFEDKIRNDFQKNGKQKTSIIVTLLKKKQQNYYDPLKKLIISELGIPHQVVLTRKVDDDKRRMAICANILLQMNAKINNPLWKIITQVPTLKAKKVLLGGMSIFHKLITKTQSCCSFVGTTNNELTEFFSKGKLIPTNQTRFQEIKAIIQEWVKAYCKKNKGVPDYIIIYRQGVGDSQLQSIIQNEVNIVKQTLNLIKKKMKMEEMNIQIAFITVNKKINQRMFETERSTSRDRSKGARRHVDNPPPGSIIGKGLSKGSFDFHMSPHFVNQGTCTPTHFRVICNTTDLKQNQLETFTYQQCYSYYNWQGPVRTPGVLQYANKLATLIGDSLKSNPHKDLEKSLYYL